LFLWQTTHHFTFYLLGAGASLFWLYAAHLGDLINNVLLVVQAMVGPGDPLAMLGGDCFMKKGMNVLDFFDNPLTKHSKATNLQVRPFCYERDPSTVHYRMLQPFAYPRKKYDSPDFRGTEEVFDPSV